MSVVPQEFKQALDVHRSSGDLGAYVQAEIDLEQQLVTQADAYLFSGQLKEAEDCWALVAELNRELVETLGTQGNEVDLGEYDSTDITRQANWLALVASGRAELLKGQQLMAERNPGAAADHLKAAQGTFLQANAYGGGVSMVFAEYAGALSEFATGVEEMMRGDFDSAATAIMRARVAMDNLLEQTLPKQIADEPTDSSAELLGAFQADAFAIASQYEKSSFMARMAAGEYSAAVDHATSLGVLLQNAVDALPAEAAPWQKYAIEAQLAWAQADKERATAFVLREQEQWVDVQAAYERARNELSNAASLFLRTGLPGAAATQESLMAMATVTIAPEARQAEAERKLKESINQLRAERQELIERISSAGVTVNNAVEAVSIAEQNTEVAVQMTQSVKTLLPELRAALESIPLGHEGDELKKEIDALEQSDEPPKSFLERAKTLTRRLADIVKNVGDAAQPVIPVIQKLAPLVGLALAVL
jgi:hypothetical protein